MVFLSNEVTRSNALQILLPIFSKEQSCFIANKTARQLTTTTEVDKEIPCVTIVKLLIHSISKRISNIFFVVHCFSEICLVA